jgi:hypothetical protein
VIEAIAGFTPIAWKEHCLGRRAGGAGSGERSNNDKHMK